jgi:threonine synthase
MSVAYLDPRSGATFPLDTPRWCGVDHAPLLLTPLPGITRGQIDRSTRSLWRYRAALPMQVADPDYHGRGLHAAAAAHAARRRRRC